MTNGMANNTLANLQKLEGLTYVSHAKTTIAGN